MTCTPIDLGNGVRGIVWRCSIPGCRRSADLLCDYPVIRKGRKGTCDAKVCEAHALHAGPDRDLCPAHAARGMAVQQGLPGMGP